MIKRRLAGRAGAEDDDVKLAAVLAGLDLAQFPVQPGLGGLVRHLPDHVSGVLRLDGRGLDHVVGCLNRRAFVVPGLPEQPARPECPDRQQDDQDDQKGETKAARMLGKPVMELGRRAEQPGRQPQRQEQSPSASDRSSKVAVACLLAQAVATWSSDTPIL